MKRRMRNYVRPRESVLRRNEQVQQEIQKFLLAVSSYPSRAAIDPGLTFRQYLCSLLATTGDGLPHRD
jgi:hypothetical protein